MGRSNLFAVRELWLGGAVLAATFLVAQPARAVMSLTAAGITEGFTLSTFASGFPSSGGVGPLGIAFPTTGGVMVTDAPGNVRVFPTDADGQLAGSVAVAQNYGFGNAIGLAQNASGIFMSRQTIGDLVQVNNDGTFDQLIVGGMPAATGVATNPVNGHVFVSTLGNNVIWDVNTVTATKTLFVNASADGLSFSGNGSVLYAEVGDHIIGYNSSTAAQVFDSGFINGLDGTAVGFGSLAGKIYGNTNFGELWEVDLGTSVQTLIASGGSRGDFVTVDPLNNSLLLTQSDTVLRLTAPAGGGFGNGGPTAVPEPVTAGLALMGLAALVPVLRRRRS